VSSTDVAPPGSVVVAESLHADAIAATVKANGTSSVLRRTVLRQIRIPVVPLHARRCHTTRHRYERLVP
jgi:hypothetical protein